MKFLRKIKTAIMGRTPPQLPQPELLDYETLRSNRNLRTSFYDSYDAKAPEADLRLLNWNGSVDYSGRVREKCLRYLIKNYQPGDENRILLRLEDWVPVIRDIAAEWVMEHINSLTLMEVEAQQDLFLYLFRKHRLRNNPAMIRINKFMQGIVAACDEAQFMDLDYRFRRHMYKISLPNDPKLRDWVARDPEPFNRLLILLRVDHSSFKPAEHEWLQNDPAPFIRRRYLYSRLSSKDKPSEKELRKLAFARNNSIRKIAQYYLNSLYNIKAYDEYKQRKDESYFFIADYAKPEDMVDLIKGFSESRKKIRLLCLKAICRIDPNKIHDIGIENLIASNARFRNVILPLLPKLLSITELQELKGVLLNSSESGILQYLRMVDMKSHWLFLKEALDYWIAHPSKERSDILKRVLYVKASIYEPLSRGMRESIIEKGVQARAGADHFISRMLDSIEFTAREYNKGVNSDE